MPNKTLISLAVASSIALTGCLDDGGSSGSNANPDYKIDSERFSGKTWPLFNPLKSELPVPNDLIFDTVAQDGTFRVSGDTVNNPVIAALNKISGASTAAPAVVRFNGRIDASSVNGSPLIPDGEGGFIPNPGQNVFLLELDYASGNTVPAFAAGEPPTVVSPLAGAPLYEAEVVTLNGDSAIRINPLEPLKPGKRFIVLVTDGVKDVNGDAISASPTYDNLTNADAPILTDNLDSVRTLINSLWEAVGAGYFAAATNLVRGQLQLPALTAENIKLSYSFTTSKDEKVLQYITEPAAWVEDQLTTFVRAASVKAVREANPAADYAALNAAADGAIANFPAGSEDSFAGLFGAGDPCEPATGEAAISCAAAALFTGFKPLLPEPESRTSSFGAPTDGFLTSAVLGQLDIGYGDINISQGTVTLPYYLTAPGSAGTEIISADWTADTELAKAINTKFKDAGLVIPQGDPSKTDVVNYIFPFPKETGTVDSATLVIYPGSVTDAAGLPVVMYQHGITTDRSAALAFGSALVNGLSAKGLSIAVVAIDQPLHGVAPFSREDQEALAERFLDAGQANTPPLPPELAASPTTINALIAGELAVGFFMQATGQPDKATAAATVAAINGGATSGDAGLDAAVRTLTSFQNTVANAGSTVPGIAKTDSERHFDFTANSQNQPVPMSFDTANPVGESGSLFINLSNFTVGRDNLRQNVTDLLNVRASLGTMDIDNDGDNGDLDGSQVFFIGHSLGTITGAPFVAVANANQVSTAAFGTDETANDITATNLLTPGAGIVRLLENSEAFSPRILGGLAAASGLQQGDADLETFFNVFQATLDTVDPINFANELESTKILLSEVIGDNVIPNDAYPDTLGAAFQAPLAGTEPLAMELDAQAVTSGTVVLDNAAITRYTEGTHSTPVLPQGGELDERVFAEMVSQAASVIGSAITGPATAVVVNDAGVIKQD